MSVDGLILGVDLDGVCADFYGRMREIAAEWFERPLSELTETPSYGLEEWGVQDHDQYESLHRFAVTQRGLFKTCSTIPGARVYLRKLSDEGVRIRIITHRLSSTSSTATPSARPSTGWTTTASRTGTSAS